MWMQRTTSKHGTRRAFTTAAAVAAAGGLMLATTGTATASTVVEDSCSGEVKGTSGDTVAVTGASLSGAVRDGAQEVKDDRLIPWLSSISPDDLAGMIEGEQQINVGQVPNNEKGTVSGEQIGQRAVDKLDDAGLWDKRHLGALIHKRGEVLDHIKSSVAEQCGLTVVATDKQTTSKSASSAGSSSSGGTSSKSTGGSGSTANSGGGSAGKQSGGDGTAAPRDYSNIPEAEAPSADMSSPSEKVDEPPTASLPQAPFPSGPKDNSTNSTAKDADQSQVANAGKADALDQQPEIERVQGPMLLAVIALALATAGLVRSWVMRRT